MARMIPNQISDESSSGEKKIFEKLKKLPDEYIVMHSLKMLKHIQKVEGEIDFLIICPKGILCIEVKGGRVERRDGIWFFKDRYGNENTKVEGPYEQVAKNMYSLIEYLKDRLKNSNINVSNIQFAYAVSFPDIEFDRQEIDTEGRITIDIEKLENNEIKAIIDDVYKYHADKFFEKYNKTRNGLNSSDISKITTILRGDFGYSQSLSSDLKETEKILIKLTEEQKQILGAMEENKRILIKGTGGTGKTVLLYEQTLKLAALGKKVIFICYNKALSKYLNIRLMKEDEEIKKNVKIVNLHAYMLEQVKKVDNGYIVENTEEFFENKLPQDFVKTNNEVYEVMVLDEAQDLIRMQYFECLEKILIGGLKNGNWYMALDEKQNIYNKELEELLQIIEEDIRPVVTRLTKNCRNTMQISTINMQITGINQSINNEAIGEDVEIIKYCDDASQKNTIKKVIRRLKMNGIKDNEITILSKHSYEESVFKGDNFLKDIAKVKKIVEYTGEENDNCIKFSTIHSFKGLESKIIILCDVDKTDDIDSKILNYVAISRAKLLLYILCSENVDL